jgi:hypothetical protein
MSLARLPEAPDPAEILGVLLPTVRGTLRTSTGSSVTRAHGPAAA